MAKEHRATIKWTQFTKRTDDPKLAWLERQLTSAGIPHQRNGSSWHAPILEVAANKLDAAWAILTPRLDNMRDDAKRFLGHQPHDWLGEDWQEEEPFDPVSWGRVGKDGRP